MLALNSDGTLPDRPRILKIPGPGQQRPEPAPTFASPMDLIVHAARQRKIVQINYTKKDGTTRWMAVEPYSTRGDKLYAYCEEHQAIHCFFISRIKHAALTSTTYKPRWDIEL